MRCVVGVGSSIASLPTFDVTKISECCVSQRMLQKLPRDYIICTPTSRLQAGRGVPVCDRLCCGLLTAETESPCKETQSLYEESSNVSSERTHIETSPSN